MFTDASDLRLPDALCHEAVLVIALGVFIGDLPRLLYNVSQSVQVFSVSQYEF